MYSLQVHSNAVVNPTEMWNRAQVVTSDAGLKSSIYELKETSASNHSAVEIDQNRSGNVNSIIAFREFTDRFNKTSNEVRITSYTDNDKVKSSTTCWNDGGCATVNQAFCDRVKKSIGASTNTALKNELKTCEKISASFRDAARGTQADLKILKDESAAQIKQWTSSKTYSKYVKATPDKVFDFFLGDDGFTLPKFSGGYAEQMKIYASLSACDYFDETRAFEDQNRDGNSSRTNRKEKRAK
jgi:hypothetical protein